MEKVKCINCGSIGYTASPDDVRCSECAGRHVVVRSTNDRFYTVPVTGYLKRLISCQNALYSKKILMEV
jgi:DNA-directed RNA polymerase subunit RPC12/RpoP